MNIEATVVPECSLDQRSQTTLIGTVSYVIQNELDISLLIYVRTLAIPQSMSGIPEIFRRPLTFQFQITEKKTSNIFRK